MKTISRWAAAHRTPARVLLVALQILRITAAGWLGVLLFYNDTVPALWWGLGLSGLVVVSICAWYWSVKPTTYAVRKRAEGVVIFILPLMIATAVSNQLLRYESENFSEAPQAVPIVLQDGGKITVKKQGWFKRLFNRTDRWKEDVVREKRNQTKSATSQPDLAVRILLAILIIAALGFLTLILYCNLACSGLEVLAIIVLLLGAGATIWAAVAILQWKPKRW